MPEAYCNAENSKSALRESEGELSVTDESQRVDKISVYYTNSTSTIGKTVVLRFCTLEAVKKWRTKMGKSMGRW